MIYHIYRPEITTFEPTPDHEWKVSRFGAHVVTLFYPMADEDRAVKSPGVLLRTVRNGEQPADSIIPPDGSFLEMRGKAMFLFTPDGKGTWKTLDAFNAYLWARDRREGFDLVGRQEPEPERAPVVRKIAPPPAYSIEHARAEVEALRRKEEAEMRIVAKELVRSYFDGTLPRKQGKSSRAKSDRREAQPSLFGDL